MSKNSALGDLEEASAGVKMKAAAAEEEVAVVDSRRALFIRRALDIVFVVYLLFYIGMVVVMVMVSDNWWDPWPCVVILSPVCIATLWLTPKMKKVYVELYATKRTAASDNDLSTKLLAYEK